MAEASALRDYVMGQHPVSDRKLDVLFSMLAVALTQFFSSRLALTVVEG